MTRFSLQTRSAGEAVKRLQDDISAKGQISSEEEQTAVLVRICELLGDILAELQKHREVGIPVASKPKEFGRNG